MLCCSGGSVFTHGFSWKHPGSVYIKLHWPDHRCEQTALLSFSGSSGCIPCILLLQPGYILQGLFINKSNSPQEILNSPVSTLSTLCFSLNVLNDCCCMKTLLPGNIHIYFRCDLWRKGRIETGYLVDFVSFCCDKIFVSDSEKRSCPFFDKITNFQGIPSHFLAHYECLILNGSGRWRTFLPYIPLVLVTPSWKA